MRGQRPSRADEPERFWREGEMLVCEPEAALPARCVACNEPGNGQRIPRTVRAVNRADAGPARYLEAVIILLGVLSSAVLTAGLARSLLADKAGRAVTAYCQLCSDHARRRQLGNALSFLGFALPIAGLACWFAALRGLLAPFPRATVLLIAGGFLLVPGWLLRNAAMPKDVRSNPSRLRIRVDPRFLASIPEREPLP